MASKLRSEDLYQFQVILNRDPETGQTVAHLPALDITDHGVDTEEALDRLKDMLVFHLDCLASEGKPIPHDDGEQEGFYLRVRLPVGAS